MCSTASPNRALGPGLQGLVAACTPPARRSDAAEHSAGALRRPAHDELVSTPIEHAAPRRHRAGGYDVRARRSKLPGLRALADDAFDGTVPRVRARVAGRS